MRKKLGRYREIIRVGAFIPFAAFIQVWPINIILLGVQLTCIGIMLYIGFDNN